MCTQCNAVVIIAQKNPENSSNHNSVKLNKLENHGNFQLFSGVDPADVGIIAPYRQQIAKMRQILKSLELPVPKIGSVEEFQGQEKPIIIVTTVRSQDHQSYVKADAARGLGFLQCEKRFNVAITRAMSLLIVIGDPHLLAEDQSWLEFLKHCINLKAYKGCDLPLPLTFQNLTE